MKRKLDFIIDDDGASYACLNDIVSNLVDSERVQTRLRKRVLGEASVARMTQDRACYVNCDQVGSFIVEKLRDEEQLDPARCGAVVDELMDEADIQTDDGVDPVELMRCLVDLYQAVRHTDGPFPGVVLADIKRHYGHIQNLVNIKEQKKSLD